MTRTTHRAIFFAASVALAGSAMTAPLFAKDPPKPVEAPTVATLAPQIDGFKWGMTRAEVAKVHNQVGGYFDKQYNPILQKMQPGVRMQAVESERESLKTAFTNSFLEFKGTPVGYDTTGLRGEYSYKNKEGALILDHGGKKRFFFFIGDSPNERLWKIYDEVPLADGGAFGKTYQEAVTKANGLAGGTGVARPVDATKYFLAPYTEWQDASTHMRIVDRSGERLVGVVFEDKNILNALPQLRSNKADDPMAMDPSVAAITKSGVSDPNAAREEAKKDPKKKK